ncbi:hypothetical protein PSHT_05416, partial [Puccinia striiformis]
MQRIMGNRLTQEPVNLKFPLQFSSSLHGLNVIAVVCPLATCKTLQYSSQTLSQCPQSWSIACWQVGNFFPVLTSYIGNTVLINISNTLVFLVQAGLLDGSNLTQTSLQNINGPNSHLKISSCSATM